jgi:5-methylcytosine-specific restriction endonuclease McrA
MPMSRPNDFPRAVKVAAIRRAMRGSETTIYCDGCSLPGKGDLRVDHIVAAGLGGKPTLANAQVLFECCFRSKDSGDNRKVKYASRVEARHLGVAPKRQKLQSRGFQPAPPKPSRTARPDKALPRRDLYRKTDG